jgi:hypothetical protein
MQPLTSFYSAVTVYTVKEKGGKPDTKPYSLRYGLRNPYRNRPEISTKLYVHKFGFSSSYSTEIRILQKVQRVETEFFFVI